jgi:uncharacterized protein YdeI (YjbR/CyaY-like superfamily)
MPKNPKWSELENRLRQLLAQTELKETIKWGIPVFTFEGKNVLGFAGMKNHFGLWFYNGVFLSDPDQLLINAQEGKTKALRQWRLEDAEELDEQKLLALVREAIANEKKGLIWKPERSEPLPIPELLADQLKNNSKLNAAFEELSPFKQKEYIEYLTEAKREATKLSRLEKIIPMILQGIGLNDKYR